MPSNVTYQTPGEIASIIPVFPLPGALLLPRGQMPLNIFEPRYVSMIDMALATHRLIGMIQPMEEEDGPAHRAKALHCGLRGPHHPDRRDRRWALCAQPHRRLPFQSGAGTGGDDAVPAVRGDYAPFAVDLEPRAGEDAVDRKALLAALKAFSEKNDIPIDWDNVNQAPNEALVNALCMMSPFGIKEKQALLEAPDLATRSDVLVAITEMELARGGGEGETRVQ